jgi:hypothetical protein
MPNPKKRKQTVCFQCKNEFEYLPSQSHGKYCSNKCQIDYQYNKKIQEWKSGTFDGTKSYGFTISNHIRRYLLEQSNHKCIKCGWNEINPTTKKSPLEIDHIDGNSTNNKLENLRVLCPNCHSLTETYKALNKGKGNKARLRYFKR